MARHHQALQLALLSPSASLADLVHQRNRYGVQCAVPSVKRGPRCTAGATQSVWIQACNEHSQYVQALQPHSVAGLFTTTEIVRRRTCRHRNRRREHFSAASVSLLPLSRVSPATKRLRITQAYLHHFSEYGQSGSFDNGRTHLCQIICQKDVYITPKIAKACRLSSLGV